eukprot:COSAG06_NODE_20332_length_799_cov_1.404286_1_plen_157_part_10
MQPPELEPEPASGAGAATAASRAVVFPSRFASPGTDLDAALYSQLLNSVDDRHDRWQPVHVMPGSGMQPQERPPPSPLTLHIETLQVDNLPSAATGAGAISTGAAAADRSLHAWMVNPEVGYPECLPDAALRHVDVVLCKSRAAVRLMRAYKRRRLS